MGTLAYGQKTGFFSYSTFKVEEEYPTVKLVREKLKYMNPH